MTQPTPYSRAYSFVAFQVANPAKPLPADQIEDELAAIELTLDQVIANLALIQRDDTGLANKTVGYDQFKAEIGIGFAPPTVWATGVGYTVRDTVFNGVKLYRCNVAHTSGTFATDLTAAKWVELADFTITLGGSLSTLQALSLVSGDILYASGVNTLARLPKGTDGQVLKLASGLPSWGTDNSVTDGDKGDITVSASGATWTIDNDVVSFAKMQNINTDSLIGRDTAASGDPENIGLNATLSMDGAGNLQRAALTGDVTAAAGGNATTIANDAVTYAKMQDISATARVLGRKTAAAGDTEECTLSEVLDFIGSAAQGDILYRGAASWARLGAGTSGQFLKTLGAGANPAWDTVASGGMTLITSGSFTAVTTLDFTGLSTYRYIKFVVKGARPANDGVDAVLKFSTDAGSTWTAANWEGGGIIANAAAAVSGDGDSMAADDFELNLQAGAGIGNAAGEGMWSIFEIESFNRTNEKPARCTTNFKDNAGAAVLQILIGWDDSGVDFDAIRFQFTVGDIAAVGTYELWGVAG